MNAIAQIGGPSSAVYLERVSIYDKKQDVRDAAVEATLAGCLGRCPSPGKPRCVDRARRSR
ncbi:MAG: hypothetical protein U0794_10755 [Isosphaeraceae bacterium]